MSSANNNRTLIMRLVVAVVFVLAGLGLTQAVPSIEIAWVMAILLLTIYLFAFEIVGVDVAAVTIMVILGLIALPFVLRSRSNAEDELRK